jgi:hypothetical protein
MGERRSDGEQLGFLTVSGTFKDEPDNILRTPSNGMKEASEGMILLPKRLQLLLQGDEIIVGQVEFGLGSFKLVE